MYSLSKSAPACKAAIKGTGNPKTLGDVTRTDTEKAERLMQKSSSHGNIFTKIIWQGKSVTRVNLLSTGFGLHTLS